MKIIPREESRVRDGEKKKNLKGIQAAIVGESTESRAVSQGVKIHVLDLIGSMASACTNIRRILNVQWKAKVLHMAQK